MRRVLSFILTLTATAGVALVSSNAQGVEVFPQVATAAKTAAATKEQFREMVKGEVLKVDNDMSKIVIKHQELVGLGMPAMTMVFTVSDRSLLDGVRPGEKIKFAAQIAPHCLLVTKIELENN